MQGERALRAATPDSDGQDVVALHDNDAAASDDSLLEGDDTNRQTHKQATDKQTDRQPRSNRPPKR